MKVLAVLEIFEFFLTSQKKVPKLYAYSTYLNENVQVGKVIWSFTFFLFSQILRDSQIVCTKVEDTDDETAGMCKLFGDFPFYTCKVLFH